MKATALILMLAACNFHCKGGEGAVVRSEFIFEKAPFAKCHASTIVESESGLVTAWFGGTDEGQSDVGIWLSREEAGKWTAPVEVANGKQTPPQRFPAWNPVLFQPKGGPLFLFYKVGPSPSKWWGMRMTSSDGGKNWSAPERIAAPCLGPIKNKPVQLANGDILSPSSTEDNGWRVHFERSSDGGRTWKFIGPVNDGKEIRAIQPSILTQPDGRLQAIGRTREHALFTIDSADGGQTWDPMSLLPMPNPNSGIDAVTLADGRHVLVYNHSDHARSPLNVAVSKDGKQWQAALVLESEPGEYSYPAVIQARDGMLHVTYTWKRERIKHVTLDPAKFTTREIVKGMWPD